MGKHDVIDTVLRDLQANERVQEMKNYIQHGNVSTYEHCENVARLSYRIDRRLRLNSDPRVLLRGAMLHDFFLYDWHAEDGGAHRLHGFTHPSVSCANAEAYCDIDEKTKQVIACHMWPLTPGKIPHSREAWIVCLADKCVSLYETLLRR